MNLGVEELDLQARVADVLGIRVAAENDVKAAALGAYALHGAVGSVGYLNLGTGIAAGIVRDGVLWRGAHGTAGEVGHVSVDPSGPQCGCGQRGCIEQYGSGRALLRMANEIADAGGIGQHLATARDANGGVLDGADLATLIAGEDPGALAALRELGSWLGQACASISAVLDPELFVFGGGVAIAGDLLLDPIREAYLAHLPARGFHPEPRFETAELVNDAGVVGAADLARIHAGSMLSSAN